MRNSDGRKLDHQTLEQFRIRFVQRVQESESPETVIKALGMSYARIYEWLAVYREGGFDALRAKSISGRPRKLTGHPIRRLYTLITSFNSLQLKFEFALWTRSAV
jgi:hypothetical protein